VVSETKDRHTRISFTGTDIRTSNTGDSMEVRCSSRTDCAMGTRCSGLTLRLVNQKQSDGALERGFGCT
jgi:hypothetical protein